MQNADYHVLMLAAGTSRRLAHLTEERPKGLLPAGNKKIVEHTLAAIDRMGFRQVTMIVGYLKDVYLREIGNKFGNLQIDYIESPDYATTGHGWSMYQAKDLWMKQKKPVLMLHADCVYDPRILAETMKNSYENATAVDNQFVVKTNDELAVCGTPTQVTRIVKIHQSPTDVLGELIGSTKWSPAFMESLFAFMDTYFKENGPNHNWEPVVDAFIQSSPQKFAPVLTGGMPWINVNYEEDLREAERIALHLGKK